MRKLTFLLAFLFAFQANAYLSPTTNTSGVNSGDITLGALGASPNANGATLAAQVLNLEAASASFPGVVSTGSQTLAGVKSLQDGISIGGGGSITKILTGSATLDFGSIVTLLSADLTITVTGAAVGDPVMLALPASPTAGIIFNGYVSATNTVTIRGFNITALSVDPASATYKAIVFHF